ncbi:MAG TPA: hypothetical protein PLN21_18070 [Gemmatales bacterium]|nr:hypothetical protein [Gemmatales bacterium]
MNKPRRARLNIETLEARDCPAIGVSHTNFWVTFNLTSPSDVSVAVTDIEYLESNLPGKPVVKLLQVTAHDNLKNKDYSAWIRESGINKVTINGGSGADKITVDLAMTTYIYGNGGKDFITGGQGINWIYGGDGDDTLIGNGKANHIYGGYGNDTILGGDGPNYLFGDGDIDDIWGGGNNDEIHGGSGDDTLHGMGGNDRIYGEDGNDTLWGGNDEDSLYGGKGNDKLYGENGSDFLDDGSGSAVSAEINDGGSGNNFMAYLPVIGGTTGKDVVQGSQNTCWILSSIISAADSGMDLKSRITYLGNGQYNVMLYNPSTKAPFYQKVSMEGGRFDFEPWPNGAKPGNDTIKESWVLIMQRAILKQFVTNIADPSTYPSFATSPSQSLPYLTGRGATFQLAGGTYLGTFGYNELDKVADSLAAGKLACAGARQGNYGDPFPGFISVATPYIKGSHVYSIMQVDKVNQTVMLRNPWGVDVSKDKDGNILNNMKVQGSDDGIIKLSYAEFVGSFAMMSVS